MEASTAIRSRLIGAILIEKNLITGEQLERALQLQEDTGERLGEIVVAEFGISRLELAGVLAEQWADLENAERNAVPEPDRPVQHVEPLIPADVQIRRPLGEIFVELGFVSSDQLDAALEAQRETGARIGEILVEQGSLTRLDLASALAEQWSALQKLRPPAPVAGPQPWQNGVPVAPPAEQGWSADDRAVVAGLEERLRAVERAAGATPWQEDLRLVTSDLRAALSAVEERIEASGRGPANAELVVALEAVSARIEALESTSVSTELDLLRQGLEEVSARPVDVGGLAELRAQVERLEARPDRTDDVAHLATEITTLAARLDEIADVAELTDRLDIIAGQADVAQTGITGLSRRVDDLADLESRIDEVAVRLPGEDVIDELKRALAELATQSANDDQANQRAEVASLVARLDQLAARVEDVAAASVPDVTPRIDELAGRIEEVAGAIPVAETHDLATRLESLEEGGRAGSAALERLATEFGELGTRTQERLDALASREPDRSPVDELRARVDDLAAEREPDTGLFDEIRGRLDELAAAVERTPDMSLVDGLRFRVDDLAAVEPDTAPLDGIRARLDELAAGLHGKPDLEPVDELRARVDDLAAVVAQEPDTASFDEIRARLDELAARVERAELVGALEARVDELEHRLAAATPAEELRKEMRRVAESTVVERESLAQALYARVEEITATIPREDELREIRSRLDELAARPTEDHALGARVAEVAARLAGLGAVEGTIADLRESLDGLDAWRVGDALATGARLAGLEAAVDALAGVETRAQQGVDRTLADRVEALTAQLDGAESRLDTVVALEARVAALAAELERRPDDDALASVAAELRAEFAALADRPTTSDPGERLLELSQRIDRSARDGHDRIGGLAEELNLRIAEADHARATGQQELGNRMDEAVAAIRSDLDAREQALAERVTDEAGAVRSELGEQESAFAGRLQDAVGAVRADLDGQVKGLGSQLQAQSNETVALRARVEELQETAAGRAAFEARLESTLEQRLEGLGCRIADEVAAARTDAEQATAAARSESGSFGARIDELLGLHQADVQTARAAAEGVAAQIGDLRGLRSGDLAAAELAGAELAARLDDHAERSAAAASEVEQALREELGGVAARLEERDAQGVEAREELRGELERVASSVGWRLERIEESLASDDSAELKATVAELERRLEGQVAMGDEQVRVTERALRKGLASLGERLAGSESAYVDAGNTLRRSIERLGAAVVEADARMADQIPVSEAEGCVAFAPTAAGYRLVELPGKPPEIGSTVELEGCDGPLLVTRYGRSPLPLDSRPCAYLDRA